MNDNEFIAKLTLVAERLTRTWLISKRDKLIHRNDDNTTYMTLRGRLAKLTLVAENIDTNLTNK